MRLMRDLFFAVITLVPLALIYAFWRTLHWILICRKKS